MPRDHYNVLNEKTGFGEATVKQPKYVHHFAEYLDMDSVALEVCSRTLASELRLSDSLYPFHLISTVQSARDALVALPSIIMRPPRRKGYCN